MIKLHQLHCSLRMLGIVFFLAVTCSTHAQFSGSLGIGMGHSKHADGYSENQQIRIQDFSGYRMLVFQADVKYAFKSGLGIFMRQEASPAVSTVSPYHYVSSLGGLQFKIPNSAVLLESAWGYNWTYARKESQGKGSLLSFGAGIQSGGAGLILRYYTGQMSIRDHEQRLTATVYFNPFDRE